MKKLLFSLAILFIASLGANAIAQEITSGAQIQFDKDTHDYGDVEFGGDGTCTFTFKNTGTEPLIISNAKGSCGCTVPSWPKEPIAPGKTGTITVKYDTKRPGAINKSVTITSNAGNKPTEVVRIKGNVLPQPESGAPVNTGSPVNN